MSYTPTSWSTGDTITAAAMNKIENGIANAGGGDILFDIGVEDNILDKTWTEILTALSSGKVARVIGSGENLAFSEYVVAASYDGEYYAVYVAGNQGWYQTSSASGYPELAD